MRLVRLSGRKAALQRQHSAPVVEEHVSKPPAEHANKNKHRFDGYLILTDGGARQPGFTQNSSGDGC